MAYVDKNSHSFIPVGLLKTYDGVKVSYKASEKKLDISSENTQLTLNLGSRTAYVDGKKVTLKLRLSPKTAVRTSLFSSFNNTWGSSQAGARTAQP
nr:stalk domain-containing protein [Paenibacillus sp. JCM 10914]